jgi:hypothetical protein
MITEKWIYRVFYGALIFSFCFAFSLEAWSTKKVPSVPINDVLLLAALTGTPAVLAFLTQTRKGE